jgi:hypothetical protein
VSDLLTRQIQRAWTFQEYLLSSRKLIFTPETIIWECNSGAGFESPLFGTWGSGVNVSRSFRQDFFKAEFATTSTELKLIRVRKLINSYNNRKLTYPEDGLNAFEGALSALQQGPFRQGFLWGVPVDIFSYALLWRPLHDDYWMNVNGDYTYDMHRRSAKSPAADPLPSWSWVGWQGYIEYHTEDIDFIQSLHTWQITELALPSAPRFDVGSRVPQQPGRFLFATGVQICNWHVRRWKRDEDPANRIDVLSHERNELGDLEEVGHLITHETFSGDWSGVVQCVAISSCFNPSLRRGDIADYGTVTKHYKVLWVENEGDYMIRKGIGSISISAWDSAPGKGLIDLKLG